MIILDVGCQERESEESVRRLIDRFHPELLLGFDPDPALAEGAELVDGTLIVRRRACAWIDEQPQPVEHDGIRTGIDYRPDRSTELAEAVDVPALLWALPTGTILKLDCEGAELEILRSLRLMRLDERLALALVEWHPVDLGSDHGRGLTRDGIRAFAARLRCPVEEWAWATEPVLEAAA